MKIVYVFLVLMGCLGSCKDGQKKNEVGTDLAISFSSSTKAHIFDYIEEVKYLKLQDRDEALLAYANKLICHKDQIYIGDYSNHKIVVFDTTGTFRYVIDQQGRGAEEYLQIKSFVVDDSCLYILDTFLPGLHVFDNRTGQFVGKKKMAFMAWDVETLSQGRFIFTYSHFTKNDLTKGQPPYRLLITDNDLNIIHQMFPLTEDDYDPIGKNVYFTSNDREIVYNWCMTDSFVVIDKEYPDRVRTVTVNFGSNQIPEVCRKDYDLMVNKYDYLYETPLVNGNYIAMEVNFGEKSGCYLYHIPSGQLLGNCPEDTCPYVDFPGCCTTHTRFVEVITNKLFYDELIETGFPRANAELEKQLEDGIALLIYKMKG